MPTYSYKCTAESCDNIQEDTASMKTYEDHHPACVVCGSVCNYVWVPSVPYVSFIDGPTGSWPSKGDRFKKYRAKASEDAGRRQRERFGEVKGAVPNYNGKETGTWQEAQFQALKDKGSESAATFNDKVSAEKNDPGKIKI
jgi:hypothetical protein